MGFWLFYAIAGYARSRARSCFRPDANEMGRLWIRCHFTASLFRLAFLRAANRANGLAFNRATSDIENWFLDLFNCRPNHRGFGERRGVLGRRNGSEPLALSFR
jgi:hypothetical protein